jgi:methyl-accepting chemotaxis protein
MANPDSFRRRVVARSYWVSAPGLVIVLAFLFNLLSLTSDQWSWFLWTTSAYALTVSFPMMQMQKRTMEPITGFLADPDAADADARVAFQAVMQLPTRLALFSASGWLVPCGLISALMALRFEAFGVLETTVVFMAGVAAAFVSGSFMVFLIKNEVAPVRAALAARIDVAAERHELIRPISLRSKVLVCVGGVTIVPIIVAVVLSYSKANESLEAFTIDWQGRALNAIAAKLETEDVDAAVHAVLGDGSALVAAVSIALLEPEDLSHSDSGLSEESVALLRAELASGATSGGSAEIQETQVLSWLQMRDGAMLVAQTPRAALVLDSTASLRAFAVLLAISTAVGLGLAWLVASDVSRATAALKREAERMASGDLRRGAPIESEDELGELGRAFETMATALRATVTRVASAVERVDATAAEMASVSESVARVTADQVTGIQQASNSMEAINQQVGGIAQSAQALNSSVEESSSSILELGASGQDLNDTAETLSSRVEEVSSSIEEMVRSVSQVATTTGGVAEASEETSTSMEEMAASLRAVDVSAEEMARLSQQVVSSAENGQTRVSQTIEGMDAIREATETAETVIQNLGRRTGEIGAIIDVIDDVADETNLLALNAAIIAAQAGEHGRAFSVVADEIKDLADRVLASTKEIGSLIRAVQDESNNAIGAIERGGQSVASGVDLSAEAGISLEEITRASRDTGSRIQEIVNSVREQSRAASHVVELMERVSGGVEEIRLAATEQERGNRVVYRSATTMRDVAQQVRATTEEQATGSGRIRESVEEVRDAVETINNALQEQSAACRSAVEFLEEVFSRTRSNELSARRVDEAARGLLQHAAVLREDVQRFRV